MLRLVFTDGIFILKCDYEKRHIPRQAGFRFDLGSKSWYTENPGRAVRLRDHADVSTRKRLDRLLIRRSPWSGPLPYPEGLTPYPHQLEAASFALGQSRAYLGLAPRLGKTIVSAIAINALRCPAVFITPPFVARSIEAEFKKWLLVGPIIERLEPGKDEEFPADVLIVPDSLLDRPETRRKILAVGKKPGLEPKRRVIFTDEAHRFKDDEANRTKALFGDPAKKKRGLVHYFSRQIYLSGTPMPNRPIELYPVLSNAAPETIDFMSKFEYGMKFCSGHKKEEICPKCHGRSGRACHYCKGRGGFSNGYDFSGASNLPELQKRVVGPFMLRMKKVPGLPEKIEELVIIGDAPPKLLQMESKLLHEASPEDLVAGRVPSAHVATYRRELGKLKLKPAVDFIRSLLDDGEESILVFAYHIDVVEGLVKGLERFKPLKIRGGMNSAERYSIQQTFQGDPSRRLIIGNYVAAGLGIALDKADRVVFVEYSWVPAENDQASDRGNKIGGKDDLFVQYLVYENSIDKKTMDVNFRKKKITAHI